MATYSVYQKKVNKKGEAPIYVGFYINRDKIEVPTKISISPDFFDKSKGVIKASYKVLDFGRGKSVVAKARHRRKIKKAAKRDFDRIMGSPG
jgi:hypothetical protein